MSDIAVKDDGYIPTDDFKIIDQVVNEKLIDAQTPGFQAEFSAREAEIAGAFEEDALSEEDALDSTSDLLG